MLDQAFYTPFVEHVVGMIACLFMGGYVGIVLDRWVRS